MSIDHKKISLHKVPNGVAPCDCCEGDPAAACLRLTRPGSTGSPRRLSVCLDCVSPEDSEVTLAPGVSRQNLGSVSPMLHLLVMIDEKCSAQAARLAN